MVGNHSTVKDSSEDLVGRREVNEPPRPHKPLRARVIIRLEAQVLAKVEPVALAHVVFRNLCGRASPQRRVATL